MDFFNIIKPDMVNDTESMEFYINYLKYKLNIEIDKMYYLPDWPSVAQKLYDLDLKNCDSDSEIIKKRQLLTTILGYYIRFSNEPAKVSLYYLDKIDENDLIQLSNLKKELRRRYVINNDKYYIKILNESIIDYSRPLSKIDLKTLETDIVRVPFDTEFSVPGYNMVFFNKLHFPDPDISVINRESVFLNSINAFDEKRLVKRK